MARMKFSDIRFSADEKVSSRVRIVFLRIFESYITEEELLRIGEFSYGDDFIEFASLSDKEMRNKFLPSLDRAFSRLKNGLTGRRAVYVHQNSGIPLIGSLQFGIVDRGTNILEVKPITGCNIDCTFCSVCEGKSSKKLVDFVVEDEYLISEVRRLVDLKQGAERVKIDVFVNTHGEALLYANIVPLVRGLRSIADVGVISIITNGTMLSRKLLDDLVEAGLSQVNISINACDEALAKELAGGAGYSLSSVLDSARYAASKIKVIIAPVWLPGKNDEQMMKLIDLSQEIGAEIGIQNYMSHKMGKKAFSQVPWDDFYRKLDLWEKESGVPLRTLSHTLFATKPLEKPFRKGDLVRAEIVAPGRMKAEALAVASGRVISVVGCYKVRGAVKVRILRDKDNVFVGQI